MTDENEAAIMPVLEKVDGAIEVGDAILQHLVRRAAELGEIAGAGDPVMAAGIDNKTVMAAFGQFLAECEHRRQVEVHRHAVDQNQREV